MLNEASELSKINPGFDSRLFARRIVMFCLRWNGESHTHNSR